jgi:hypothetical protein
LGILKKNLGNRKYWTIGVIILSACFCLIVIIGLYGIRNYLNENPQSGNSPTATKDPEQEYLEKIGPVSMIQELPTNKIDYPDFWSTELVLPEMYRLVEAYGPSQLSDDRNLWVARYVIDRDIVFTIEQTSKIFIEKGWEVIDSGNAYSNIYILMFRGNDGAESISVLMESSLDQPNTILIQINAYLLPER